MPLYEFECIKCRKNIENSINTIEKKFNKKILTDIVAKNDNIHAIEVFDLENDKVLARAGKKGKDSVFQDFYINDGETLVLFDIDKYRFSELIYEENDYQKVQCKCGEKKKVEKVISGFAFTSDLSTNMPKPDLSNLPPSVAAKTNLGEYIEEKDRPKKNR